MEQEKILNNYLSTDFKQPGSLYELLSCETGNESCRNFTVPIGKKEDGTCFYNDLSKISHILISGTTGSGKTAFIHSIISSLMLTVPKESLKFVIFDSKHIDYMFFNGAPQLLIPIINDGKKAIGAINWLVEEAKNRINIQMNDRDKFKELPHIFLILDDYSEIATNNEGYEYLIRLLQIGRSTNIHCILSTSTPTSNVISTEIKANVPCRISFHTTQKSVSRMILDENGAEELKIPGEMIFKGTNETIKCAGYFVTDDEIKSIVGEASQESKLKMSAIGDMAASVFSDCEKTNKSYGYDECAIDAVMRNKPDVSEDEDVEAGDLLNAIELAFDLGCISTSLLQRRLKIGYSHAGRIIDQLEKRGIIGPLEGGKPRKLLIEKDEITKILSKNDINGDSDSTEKNIILRSFPKIESFGESIEIKNNLISIKKKINISFVGILTIDYEFEGVSVKSLVYNEPKFLTNGEVVINIKEGTKLRPKDIGLYTKYKSKIPTNEIKIKFSKNDADLFKHIVKQIAEDCSIDVKYL